MTKRDETLLIREELVLLRTGLFPRIERMRQTGDYGAGASDIRETSEALLNVIDILIEQIPRPD